MLPASGTIPQTGASREGEPLTLCASLPAAFQARSRHVGVDKQRAIHPRTEQRDRGADGAAAAAPAAVLFHPAIAAAILLGVPAHGSRLHVLHLRRGENAPVVLVQAVQDLGDIIDGEIPAGGARARAGVAPVEPAGRSRILVRERVLAGLRSAGGRLGVHAWRADRIEDVFLYNL